MNKIESLYSEIDGSGKSVVLLHGMAASHSYWDKVVFALSGPVKSLCIDLLGFGKSPKPKGADYSYQEHLRYVKDVVEKNNQKLPLVLVGHSMGALLAVRYAIKNPKDVKSLVLINPALYKNAQEAKRGITSDNIIRRMAYYGWFSKLLCKTGCNLPKSITTRVLGKFFKERNYKLLCDITDHTYESYLKSRTNIIENQQTLSEIHQLSCPVFMITTKNDEPIARNNALSFKKNKHVKIIEKQGTHSFPLEDPEFIAKIILEAGRC
jgi:cis-3-alkyl-4-acyloxetan-2-one decarboxylase